MHREELHLDDGGATMIRVHPQWGEPPEGFNTDLTPWTHFLRTTRPLLAAPKDPDELERGFLRLEGVNDRYEQPEAAL
jgi:hypothetical protein